MLRAVAYPAAWRWHACYVDLWVRRNERELALVEELTRSMRERDLLRRIKPDALKTKPGYAGTEIEAHWRSDSAASVLATRLRQLVALADEAVPLMIDEFQTMAADRHQALQPAKEPDRGPSAGKCGGSGPQSRCGRKRD